MRLGLFGGTFDPFHSGHLDVALAARHALSLDVVWLMPSRMPPHRTMPHASAAHRFAMAALGAQASEGVLVSDLEMDGTGPSYSLDSLDRLRGRGFESADLFFVTGADAFRDIPMWKGFPGILDRCHFVVVSRPGAGVTSLTAGLPWLDARVRQLPAHALASPSIFLVDARTAAVSSTDVRRAVADGRPLDGLVPAPVARYIERQGLYSPATAIHDGSQGAA